MFKERPLPVDHYRYFLSGVLREDTSSDPREANFNAEVITSFEIANNYLLRKIEKAIEEIMNDSVGNIGNRCLFQISTWKLYQQIDKPTQETVFPAEFYEDKNNKEEYYKHGQYIRIIQVGGTRYDEKPEGAEIC